MGPPLAIPVNGRSVTPQAGRAMFLVVARAAPRPPPRLPPRPLAAAGPSGGTARARPGPRVPEAGLWRGAARPAAAPPTLPNMLTNGSFEHPHVQAGASHPFASIPGWHLAYGPDIELQNHVAGAPAKGDQLAELASDGSSGIFQRVHTQPGRLYRLQFS